MLHCTLCYITHDIVRFVHCIINVLCITLCCCTMCILNINIQQHYPPAKVVVLAGLPGQGRGVSNLHHDQARSFEDAD